MFGNNDSKTKFAAAGGLVLGLILSALNYLEYLTKVNLVFGLFVVYVGGIVYFTKEYGKNVEYFGYGKSLSFGILLSMFTFIILGIYNCIYASFINPVEYSEKISEALELMKKGFINKDEGFENLMHDPLFITISYMITGILYGLLVSLITSIFTKKD